MKKRSLITLTAVALLALAGGVAYATIPDNQGVIHACYKTQNGQLRVIDDAGCAPSETALSWNQTGPPGPPGPKGDTGPAGVLGFYTKKLSFSVPAHGEEFNGIGCDVGDRATGGGFAALPIHVDVAGDDPINVVIGSQEVPGGWQFAFTNSGDSPQDVQISVVCADVTP
jgi:hypothetical protein